MSLITLSNRTWKMIAEDSDSALSRVLYQSIPDKFATLSTDAKVDLKMGIYLYILHRYTFSQLKNLVKYWGLDTKDAYTLLHAILESYEANLALKQITFICLNDTKNLEKTNFGKILKQNDMNPANELILRALPEINFGSKKLLSSVKEKPLLMPKVVRQNCEKTLKTIHPFISRFVYKKLDFVFTNNNYSPEDIIGDLVRKGVETYYRVTPLQCDLHRENSVKKSIHNQGMKLISFYTSKKRARIRRKSDGDYETKIDSIVGLNDRVDESVMLDKDWQEPTLKFEFREFIQKYNPVNSKKTVIVKKLLCDEEDNLFCNFVRSKLKLGSHYSMEAIHSKKPKIYTQLIAEYHEIPELTVKRIAWEFLRDFNGFSSNLEKL